MPANHDDRAFPPDGDLFDIHREDRPPPRVFGYGIHFCLGAALARLEGRIASYEVLYAVPRPGTSMIDNARARLVYFVRGGLIAPSVSIG